MQQRQPPGATDLLQVGATIAAIGVALATLATDKGPTLGGLRIIPVGFLLAGLPALIGSMYAMAQMWSEAGMSIRALLMIDQPDDEGYWYEALVCTAWGLLLLGVIYFALLASNAP